MSLRDQPQLHNFPDRAMREILKQVANLEELLQEVIPEQAPWLDCRVASCVDARLVLPEWRERENDLFFKVPLRQPQSGFSTLVWILLEHQTAADPIMAFRLLLYAVLHW